MRLSRLLEECVEHVFADVLSLPALLYVWDQCVLVGFDLVVPRAAACMLYLVREFILESPNVRCLRAHVTRASLQARAQVCVCVCVCVCVLPWPQIEALQRVIHVHCHNVEASALRQVMEAHFMANIRADLGTMRSVWVRRLWLTVGLAVTQAYPWRTLLQAWLRIRGRPSLRT